MLDQVFLRKEDLVGHFHGRLWGQVGPTCAWRSHYAQGAQLLQDQSVARTFGGERIDESQLRPRALEMPSMPRLELGMAQGMSPLRVSNSAMTVGKKRLQQPSSKNASAIQIAIVIVIIIVIAMVIVIAIAIAIVVVVVVVAIVIVIFVVRSCFGLSAFGSEPSSQEPCSQDAAD